MGKNILAAATTMAVCLGSAQAADRIRYEEIPVHLAPFGSVLAYRGVKVVTFDGKQHPGRRLRLEADHLRVFHLDNSYEDVPGEQVTRIEISPGGRYFHHVVENAEIPILLAELGCGGLSWEPVKLSPWCTVPLTTLFSPAWAYTAVTAPFFLVADGVAWLIPHQVYEIVH
jgi:hypothetical protein